MRKVYVITPVLNEEPNISTLIASWKNMVNELTDFNFEFIMVDDGSTDRTAALAKELSAGLAFTVISHEKNMGPGYAFGTGFESISKILKAEDIVVTIEGDN